jgi:hypothetical protein
MNSVRKKVAIGVALLAVLAGLLLFRQQPRSAADTAGPDVKSRAVGTKEREREEESNPQQRLLNQQRSLRTKNLERLKERWVEIGTSVQKNGLITSEHEALARETANELLCSDETVQLIEFLNERGMRFAEGLISKEVGNLFQSERAAEAREMLIGLSDKPTKGGHNFKEDWSYEAGRGCPEKDFELFRASLGSERCAQDALFGRNLGLVMRDPASAIASTINELALNRPSYRRAESLKQVILNLPQDVDFGGIEKLLPADDSKRKDSPVNTGRDELFRRWGWEDPAEAANYVMANPGRVGPEKITTIAESVVKRDLNAGVEWVQSFPEGPYFDAAAHSAIPYFADSYPEEAAELAALIRDPKMREQSLRIIRSKVERRQKGESSAR